MPRLGPIKYKNRQQRSFEVHPRDRSGSKVPPEKRKAKSRAQRKARKRAS